MDIGKLIRDRRLELGLTMQNVADAVGVVKSTIKKWESGKINKMASDYIVKLARTLDLSPLDLIDYMEDAPAVPDINDTEGLYGSLNPENRAVVDLLIKSLALQQPQSRDHDR